MEITYVCKKQVLPNLWHHNVLIDEVKHRVIENGEVPMSENEVKEGILSGILTTTQKWVAACS